MTAKFTSPWLQDNKIEIFLQGREDAKLTTHLICYAAAPASVPQPPAEAPGVHTLCAHMFQPHISPRRYL